ncbi:[acyl-carrier-protein] S-malonyltransferase [Chamberlinius hualienensis]
MTGGPAVQKKKTTKNGVEEEAEVVPPPDGGWGWVVVFASFMIHIIADGVTYTFGIFFVELVRFYNEGKGATSWIASILVGVTLGSGPLASALTNKYGCRTVTIAGSVVATIGFITSLFAPNVVVLYFTIGILVGLGFGLIYLPAIVSVTCYFEKKRAFATGIAVCGSGLGTFIFAPLTEFLVEYYGWKGAMLIVAGFVLNCAVFGGLFRAPEAPKQLTKVVVNSLQDTVNEQLQIQAMKRSLTANGQLTVHNPGTDTDTDEENNQISVKMEKIGNGSHTMYIISENGEKISVSSQDLAEKMLRKHEKGISGVANMVSSSRSLVWREKSPDKSSVQGPLYRRDVFYKGSLLNIPQYRSNPSMYTASITHIPSHETPDEKSSKMSCCYSIEARDALKEMMDLSLLSDPVFLIFAVSNFCTSIGFNVPYVYIKDRALLLQISSDNSSFLLAVIGISNTVSRVLLGYICDTNYVARYRLQLYSTALAICGLSTAFSSFCLDYQSQVVYAVIFGITAGAYVGLTSVILVDLLGMEKLTNAFGLLLLFQGVAALIGPPIAGWLYDWLNSYDPGFYVAGSMIAASGIMLFRIPAIQRGVIKRAQQGGSAFNGEVKFSGGEDDAGASEPLNNQPYVEVNV